MKQLLLDCDFLGKKQHFLINNNTSYPTYIGSFVSLSIILLILSLLIYFTLEIFLRQNLTLISSKHVNENPPPIYLNTSLLTFTIAIQNQDYSLYINESIYTLNISANIIKLTGHGNTTKTTIPLNSTKCSHFIFKHIPEYFSLLDLNNLYCTELNDDIYLKGEYGRSEWAYLSYEFHKCVNSSSNNYSCKSPEEIEQRLQGGYIGMFFSDLYLLPNNYSYPIKIYGKNIFTSFTANEYKDVWLYLKNAEVHTDTGLLFSNIKTEKFISYDYHVTNNDNRKGTNFISLYIRMGQNKEIYHRSYRKLQVVTAELGGMINLLLVCGEFLTYYFREMLYKDFILGFCYEGKHNKLGDVVYVGGNNSMSIHNKFVMNNSSIMSVCTICKKNSKMNLNNNTNMKRNSINISNGLQLRNRSSSMGRWRVNGWNDLYIDTWHLLVILCYGKARKKIRNVNYKYRKIGFLFDVIRFLKLNEDVNVLQKYCCNEMYNEMFGSYYFCLRDNTETDKYYACLEKRKKGPLIENAFQLQHSLRECQSQIRI